MAAGGAGAVEAAAVDVAAGAARAEAAVAGAKDSAFLAIWSGGAVERERAQAPADCGVHCVW